MVMQRIIFSVVLVLAACLLFTQRVAAECQPLPTLPCDTTAPVATEDASPAESGNSVTAPVEAVAEPVKAEPIKTVAEAVGVDTAKPVQALDWPGT